MQNRPTLKHSQVKTLLAVRDRLFSDTPLDIIWKISGYSPADNRRDFEDGLNYIANGQLKELAALLEIKPFLVLFDGKGSSVITPRGAMIKDKSFYACAIGERDPDIKKHIESVFLRVKGGEKEMKAQLECYTQAMQNKQPDDDLTWLFEVLVESPTEDVWAELKTGEAYDWNYCSLERQQHSKRTDSHCIGSDLRKALDKFRENELDLACRTISQPGMHGNDQSIVHVYALLKKYQSKLIVDGYKTILASRQILGLRQLLRLTAYDRIVFASGQIDKAIKGEEINRDAGYNYKDSVGAFPVFNTALIKSRTGLGFDFFISILGWGEEDRRIPRAFGIKTYVEQKHQACVTLCSSQPTNKKGM